MQQAHSETLFTFVLDWKGGTYISQVRAPTLEMAGTKWLNSIDLGIFDSNPTVSDLAEGLDEDYAPLDGLQSAWCICLFIDDTLGIIHVIATCPAEQN